MNRLKVDFNSIDDHGDVESLIKWVDSIPNLGDVLEAYDAEGNTCQAMVVSVNYTAGLISIWPNKDTWNNGRFTNVRDDIQ